jgi:hypothetical protein
MIDIIEQQNKLTVIPKPTTIWTVFEWTQYLPFKVILVFLKKLMTIDIVYIWVCHVICSVYLKTISICIFTTQYCFNLFIYFIIIYIKYWQTVFLHFELLLFY